MSFNVVHQHSTRTVENDLMHQNIEFSSAQNVPRRHHEFDISMLEGNSSNDYKSSAFSVGLETAKTMSMKNSFFYNMKLTSKTVYDDEISFLSDKEDYNEGLLTFSNLDTIFFTRGRLSETAAIRITHKHNVKDINCIINVRKWNSESHLSLKNTDEMNDIPNLYKVKSSLIFQEDISDKTFLKLKKGKDTDIILSELKRSSSSMLFKSGSSSRLDSTEVSVELFGEMNTQPHIESINGSFSSLVDSLVLQSNFISNDRSNEMSNEDVESENIADEFLELENNAEEREQAQDRRDMAITVHTIGFHNHAHHLPANRATALPSDIIRPLLLITTQINDLRDASYRINDLTPTVKTADQTKIIETKQFALKRHYTNLFYNSSIESSVIGFKAISQSSILSNILKYYYNDFNQQFPTEMWRSKLLSVVEGKHIQDLLNVNSSWVKEGSRILYKTLDCINDPKVLFSSEIEKNKDLVQVIYVETGTYKDFNSLYKQLTKFKNLTELYIFARKVKPNKSLKLLRFLNKVQRYFGTKLVFDSESKSKTEKKNAKLSSNKVSKSQPKENINHIFNKRKENRKRHRKAQRKRKLSVERDNSTSINKDARDSSKEFRLGLHLNLSFSVYDMVNKWLYAVPRTMTKHIFLPKSNSGMLFIASVKHLLISNINEHGFWSRPFDQGTIVYPYLEHLTIRGSDFEEEGGDDVAATILNGLLRDFMFIDKIGLNLSYLKRIECHFSTLTQLELHDCMISNLTLLDIIVFNQGRATTKPQKRPIISKTLNSTFEERRDQFEHGLRYGFSSPNGSLSNLKTLIISQVSILESIRSDELYNTLAEDIIERLEYFEMINDADYRDGVDDFKPKSNYSTEVSDSNMFSDDNHPIFGSNISTIKNVPVLRKQILCGSSINKLIISRSSDKFWKRLVQLLTLTSYYRYECDNTIKKNPSLIYNDYINYDRRLLNQTRQLKSIEIDGKSWTCWSNIDINDKYTRISLDNEMFAPTGIQPSNSNNGFKRIPIRFYP